METRTEMISIQHEGGDIPGYLARPDDDRVYPAVVVIQEWWGLVAHIKEVAERFAAEGYVALAPDLYHGKAASEPDEAGKLAMALDRDRAIAEISAAARHLNDMPLVSPKGTGVVGWCMGGGLALSAAAHNNQIKTAVCFYGRPLDAADTARLKVPVLGLYGSEDRGIPVAAVKEFEQELQARQVLHQIHVYQGAEHAFFNDTRAAYHPEAAEDAWKRTLDWFGRHLQ